MPCAIDGQVPPERQGRFAPPPGRRPHSEAHLPGVSNPCFELWLALHFEDQNAWLDTAAVRRSRTLDGTSGKDLDGTTYMPRRAGAARRARALDERHSRDRTEFPRDNPSSGMFRFLDAIEGGEPPSG